MNIRKYTMETYNNYSTTLNAYDFLDSFKTALSAQLDLREMYRTKPIRMHTSYPTVEDMKFPKAIKEAYAAIWSGKYQRIIIKAPRGGGKSKLLGTVGFDLWFLKKYKVVNMAGSAMQATQVYNYFKAYCDMDDSVSQHIAGDPLAIVTKASEGHWFSSVTASTKQTRGKHPDALISDETCETPDEIVHSALPMVNDSKNPLIIMASTFHKIYGIFQETWDNAEEKGYYRIQWDIFDVCSPFPADYWEREDIKGIMGIEKLVKHANGRTGDEYGWIPIENVIQAWREKPTEDWFEVEYLGSRPSAAGLVLKPEDVDAAMFDDTGNHQYQYIKGATVVMGIDWGFSSMTATSQFMGHRDGVAVMVNNKNYHQIASDDIIKDVVGEVKKRGIRFIYADSAGKFENNALQNMLAKENIACTVVEVVFSKEKFGTPGKDGSIGMLGNLRAHFEQRKIKIPNRFKEAYWQFKRYRYKDGEDKPVKKDDHIPDSTMCALQHFKLGQFARAIPTKEGAITKSTKPVEEAKPITAGLMQKTF